MRTAELRTRCALYGGDSGVAEGLVYAAPVSTTTSPIGTMLRSDHAAPARERLRWRVQATVERSKASTSISRMRRASLRAAMRAGASRRSPPWSGCTLRSPTR